MGEWLCPLDLSPKFTGKLLRRSKAGRLTYDRVGSRRLRAVTLPHHRTCGFPHPAVEPGSGG